MLAMTPGQAALIVLMDRYLAGLLDPFVTLLEVHKLMYFMQEAGEPLRLRHVAGPYGPYAENLEPYYETTLLSEATDPNLLYEIQSRLAGFPVHTQADVDRFARTYFDRKATQDQLYQALAPVVERARALPEAEQRDFRGHLTDYVRLYAFLAQVLAFTDADLEKLYVFARHLRRLLPADREELPREVQQNIDI